MAAWGLLIPRWVAMVQCLKSWNPLLQHLEPLVPTGKVITVKSTPLYLIGGPLADTDIALKRLPIRGGALQRVEEIKVEDEPKSYR